MEQSGFGQNEKSAGYAFIVKNPSADQAITRAEYQVAFYDEDDTIVETETGYINLILPGQSLGIGGTQYLDDGVTLKSIEVQVSDGSAVAYNEDDEIIGGGFTYVNFVPPNGQTPVEVYVTVTGTPDKVELFPALSSLDQLK